MLRTRLLTVAIVFPLFLLALFYLPAAYWSALVLLLMAIAAYEWAGLFDLGQSVALAYGVATPLLAWILCVGGFALQPSAGVTQALCVIAAVFWIALAPWLLRNRVKITGLIAPLTLGWLALIPLWAALVKLREFGPLFVFFAMGIIWLADTAAYFSGRAFGKRKLAPEISPGKTVEGALGALIVAALYAIIFMSLGQYFGTMSLSGLPLMMLGFAVIVVLSIIGDLFESWLKRQRGKKDSGNLFPGHGGILDRIDSLTSTMPVVVLALMCCRSNWGIL
jgi:phosphatidate cytidylyltransferase